MACVFDKPAWDFRIPKSESSSLALVDVKILGKRTRYSKVTLVAPMELFKYCQDILKVRDMRDLEIFAEYDESRWYLILAYARVEHELWYYTSSNIPHWLHRVL